MTTLAYPGPVDYVNNFIARFNKIAGSKGTDLQNLELPETSRIECIDMDAAGSNPWKCIADVKTPAPVSKAAVINRINTGNCEVVQTIPVPLSNVMKFLLFTSTNCSCSTTKMEDGSYDIKCSLPVVSAASPKRRKY